MTIELCDDAAYHRLLESLGGVRHDCPQCGSREHGRPSIQRGHLSITHVRAGGLRHIVALADQPIGVDAEQLLSSAQVEDVTMHVREREMIESLPPDERQQAVLRTWIAKEAALKLHGTGLQIAPESFVARHANMWGIDAGALGSAQIFLTQDLIGAVALAVATYEPVSRVHLRRTNGTTNLDC